MKKLTLLYVSAISFPAFGHSFDILSLGSKSLDAIRANKATSTLCWLSERRTTRLQGANPSNNNGRLQEICKRDDLESQ